MQYAFTRNAAALVTAIEKGISLSRDDLTLATEHLFLHPERLGVSGTVLERIITFPEFHGVNINPLILALAASPVEQLRLHILFEKILKLPLIQESHLICMTTALCSSRLTALQKLELLEKIVQHPSRTSLVLMGRFFTYELSFERSWIGLGVIEAIAFLPSEHHHALPLIQKITETPASNVQCQRSLTHALEILPIDRKDKFTCLSRILHWPNLCQHVRKRILHALDGEPSVNGS